MTPYYSDDAVTIHHGDARDILPTIGKFDLLLTDPPYGLGESRGSRTKSREKLARCTDYGESDWDDSLIDVRLLTLARSVSDKQVIFGGNYYDLPPTSCWLVWDKVNGDNDFADCELAWTNLKQAVRLKRHQWHGMIRVGKESRFHPTQKPVEVLRWAIVQAGDDVRTVMDPFAGSGTTGRAAKDLGKRSVLIEREERYCEIAAIRMAQEVLKL